MSMNPAALLAAFRNQRPNQNKQPVSQTSSSQNQPESSSVEKKKALDTLVKSSKGSHATGNAEPKEGSLPRAS
jgi:hypothetical protein